jgi:hypothetical protein
VFADDARVTKCPDGTRGYNDVAALAMNVSYYAAQEQEDGWGQTGNGMEFAEVPASIVAATAALAGAPSSTSVPARYLWQNWRNNPSVLTDITAGGASEDEDCPHYLCMAEVGWDGVTGLGVPNGVGAFRPPTVAPVAQSYRVRLGSGSAARCMGVASEAVPPAPVTVAPCGQGDRDESWRVLRSNTPDHRLAYTLVNSGGGCLTLAEGAAATVTDCAELGSRIPAQEIRFAYAHRLGVTVHSEIKTVYARPNGELWLTKSPPMGPLDAWTLVKAA